MVGMVKWTIWHLPLYLSSLTWPARFKAVEWIAICDR